MVSSCFSVCKGKKYKVLVLQLGCDWLPAYSLARHDRYNIQLFGYLHTDLSQALHMQKATPGQALEKREQDLFLMGQARDVRPRA
jgi:hypothetical protein